MKTTRKEKIDYKIHNKEPGKINSRKFIFAFIFSLVLAGLTFLIYRNFLYSGIVILSFLVVIYLYSYFSNMLKVSGRIRKMELVFPDFLQLMSSNLRAGMTVEKAMLLSSREEFAPLDKEILKAGKDITTGKDVARSLLEMAERIGSERIRKVILIIISGIRAGGDTAVLLEETSVSMRERDFVEKRAASNVNMYVIFIFLAVAIFSPALFSLSSILVDVMTKLLSGVPEVQNVSLPFTLSHVNVSTTFVFYFCIIFIILTDILASLVLGLVGKGEEKEGIKYLIPILLLSVGIFFLMRFILANFLGGLF